MQRWKNLSLIAAARTFASAAWIFAAAARIFAAAAWIFAAAAWIFAAAAWIFAAAAWVFPTAAFAADLTDAERLTDQLVRVRLMDGHDRITLHSDAPLRVHAVDHTGQLPAGTYTITAREAVPAIQRFHLFAKSFEVTQETEQAAYISEMSAKGYAPEVVTVGKKLQSDRGTILDNRVRWISIARCGAEAEAIRMKKSLEASGQWTWVNREVTEAGTASIFVAGADGQTYGPLKAPLRILPDALVGLSDVDVGFWAPRKEKLRVQGELSVAIGPDGKLELVETLPVEDYIKGVLPAEMPASWPAEALKAQAVAARSEVLVNLATKHSLERVDFCGTEHCRAYRAAGGRVNATDTAVDATAGLLLVDGQRIATTVFSANCGGATEHNDVVWSAPANRVLRGISDVPGKSAPEASSLGAWLSQRPAAYCSDDAANFRWRRSYSVAELSAIVNQRHRVGLIQEIRLGDRGVSGRLKSVTIKGNEGTVTIQKELPIRQALGGLPSALFVADVSTAKGQKTYTFIGGGRGHGVGLCQHGARGMALHGQDFRSILQHYFSGVSIERYH